jgi:hypothetical protein
MDSRKDLHRQDGRPTLSTQSLMMDIDVGLSVAAQDQCRVGDMVRIANISDVVQTPAALHGI